MTRIASANCGSVFSQTFSYDAFGNLSKSGTISFQPTYSTATNHITQIGSTTPTYDANGNITSDGTHSYSWDAAGRPVTIDGVNLTYDALGSMVEQNRSGAYTEIVYGPHGGKLAFMTGQTLQKAFVPLAGGAVAVYTSSGLAYYRHSDWLGSSRFASTPTRTMYSDEAYAPFGEPYAQSGTPDLSFTGMNQDTISGLYDFPAREYATQGRWPSPDPAGIASVFPTDPQTWNRYAYVRNTPLHLFDPSGMVIPPPLMFGGDGGGACVWDDGSNDASDDEVTGNQGGCEGQGGTWDPFLDGVDFHADPNPDLISALQDWLATNNAPCQSTGTTSILSGNATTNIPTIAAGEVIGGEIGGPPGAALGGMIGSLFGVGGNASYVPSTESLYAGPTLVFAPALGGGNGAAANIVSVPAGQNPNSIANGLSSSVTFQPSPLFGSTVVKSPGNGPPVVGPSVGTRVPV